MSNLKLHWGALHWETKDDSMLDNAGNAVGEVGDTVGNIVDDAANGVSDITNDLVGNGQR